MHAHRAPRNTDRRATAPAPRLSRAPRVAILAAALLAVGLAPAACKKTPKATGPGAPAAIALPTPPDGIAARDAQGGLELWTWQIADERRVRRIPSASGTSPFGEPDRSDRAAANGATQRTTPTNDAAGETGSSGAGTAERSVANANGRAPSDAQPSTASPDDAASVLVSDARSDAPGVFAAYADRPVPLPPDVLERWRAAGFRIVAVPRAELGRIEASARLVGAVERQWLGPIPLWTDIVRGRAPRGQTLLTGMGGTSAADPAPSDDGHGGGQARLLARAWAVPVLRGGETPAAALRLDLVPQIASAVAPAVTRIGLDEPSRPRPIEEQGVLVASLAFSAVLDGSVALVIVPESPEARWGQAQAEGIAPPPDGGPDDAADAPAGAWTLGESMLAPPGDEAAPRVRRVVALVPRVPARFSLLP